MTRLEDRGQYELPGKLAMQLSHRDVWLDYFIGIWLGLYKVAISCNIRMGSGLQTGGRVFFGLLKELQSYWSEFRKMVMSPSLPKLISLFFGERKQRNRR